LLVCCFCAACHFNAGAQNKPNHDSSYYSTFPYKVIGRVYLSKKYASFYIPATEGNTNIYYAPNSKLTLGVGATYSNFSLNVSYGFGFLNNDDEKGTTKSADLQLHVYPRKWAIDVLAYYHKGLHIDEKGLAATDASNYYVRPDAKLMMGGISAYRVANGDKFSYNAAMIQSEWQKKPAGSLLYGGEVYYGSIQGDSSLVPALLENNFKQAGVKRINFFTAGIGGGYAYTLVLKQHFYVMGSLIANIDVNNTSEETDKTEHKKTSINPSLIYKAAAGYNAENWCFSVNWAANDLLMRGSTTTDNYRLHTGNYRIILAKRISISKKNKAMANQVW